MSFTVELVNQLIEKGENTNVEFKTNIQDPSILVKQITAFANTDGGTIIIGVKEPNIIVGTEPERIKRIVELAKKSISPVPEIYFEEITINNKSLAIISIRKSSNVVFGNGMVLKRQGDQIIPLSPKDITSKMELLPEKDGFQKLAEAVSIQTKSIEELKKELKESNSIKSKIKDYFIGGIIGAVIGAIVTALIGLV